MNEEVHFFKLEGRLASAKLQQSSTTNYKSLLPLVNVDPELPVSDWTVVDLDNFLKGNPHVSGF